MSPSSVLPNSSISDSSASNPTSSSPDEARNVLAEQLFIRSNLGPTLEEQQAWLGSISLFSDRCAQSMGIPSLPELPIGETEEQRSAAIDSFLFDRVDQISQTGYAAPASLDLADVPTQGSIPDTVIEACRGPVMKIYQQAAERQGFDPGAMYPDTDLVFQFREDPAMTPVYTQWAECVTSQGFPDPRTLESPSDGSIQMALADSACRGSTGFRDAKVAWFKEKVSLWLDENSETVAAARAYWIDLVDSAVKLAEA